MSEDKDDQTEEAPESENLDASFKVDTTALSDEESDFARQMGFGTDGNEGAKGGSEANVATTPSNPDLEAGEETESPDPEPLEAQDGDEAGEDQDVSPETDPTEEIAAQAETVAAEAMGPDAESEADPEPEAEAAASEAQEATPADTPSDKAADWEDIPPRSAKDGIQATMEARAETLRGLEPDASSKDSASVASIGSKATMDGELAAMEERCAGLQSQLDQNNAELCSLRASRDEEMGTQAREEKELEELRSELDTLSLDRDQLIDQLAVASGQLVQATARGEKLEASLRAARGALTPLPEGERALRAEVIGLRGRLDEARQESQEIANQLAASATELAIARARFEDRQHEMQGHIERAAELETQLAENDDQLKGTLARHREMIAMTTRLQADNNELRSAQAALEETLEARDLEIVAREEHLTVTRQGLSARDLQLVDLTERLDQEHRQGESLEADLQRSRIHYDQLIEKIAHRESRIATLTQTLARIEEAMGHPIPGPGSKARDMPQAEWSRPTPAREIPRSSIRTSTPIPPAEQAIETRLPEACEAPAPSAIAEDPARSDAAPSPAETPEEPESTRPLERLLIPPPSLPAILTAWRDRRFGEVTGRPEGASVHGFLAERLQNHFGQPGPESVYLKSLGGSLPDAEVRLVSSLRDLGITKIRMEILDREPEQADARRHKIELAGLGEIIDVTVGDLDQWDAQAPCHAILLSDALHSQPAAGEFLDHIGPTIADGALVLFLDRIATGPLQLSASALIRLEELWALLPESLTQTGGLSVVPHRGEDGGFPGAASDPTKEILERMEPLVIAGFGHLADLIVGPTRGPAMSTDNDDAVQLLESIMAMDESRSLAESLTPRHGLGVFAHVGDDRTEIIGHDWPSEPKSKGEKKG